MKICKVKLKKNQTKNLGRIWITFGDLTIPRLVASCDRLGTINEENLNFYYRTAISLGRFKQNPLAEISQLWHEEVTKNFCLSIPLHPLMKSVNQIKLVEALENEAVRIINFIGIDLNKTCEFSHLNSTLQFISGLGPRKSNDLINRIISKGFIENRTELIEDPKLMKKKVFTNSSGFLRIKRNKKENILDIDPLDSTRIHPENYPLAYKVAKATLDENISASYPQKEAVKSVLKDPRKLECLDLQEYIKKSYEKGNKNIEMQINFIKSEFQKPFFFERIHKDLQPSEIFHLFLNDSTFCRGQLVHATVLKVDEHHVKCKLTNELEATIWVNDLFDEDRPEDKKTDEMKIMEMKQRFKEGMVIDGRVKSIDEHKFKIDLNLKQSELESVKNYYLVRGHDKYFEINEDEDLKIPNYSKEKKSESNKYIMRNIQYNHFKNINLKTSLDLLRQKDIGTFVYRPSSKGENYLNLSWKFYHETYMHVEIVEEDKVAGKSIGNRLRINNEYYRSLNEITERYLKPCEMIVKDVIENRKFIRCENSEDFQMKILKEEKASNRNYFIYYFTIIPEFPGFILLGYSAKQGNFTKEFIRVRPRGLYFHNENFSNLEDLSSYFKKNYGNESYREFVKKLKVPQIEENRRISLSNTENDFSMSMNNDGISVINSVQNNSIFERDSRNSDNANRSFRDRNNYTRGSKTCHNCGQYGHFVSDCPSKNIFIIFNYF
jgi:transcription elongation factor SPT6